MTRRAHLSTGASKVRTVISSLAWRSCCSFLDGSGTRGAYRGKPICEWELAEYSADQDWRESYRTVGQFMTEDLFTVRPDDIVDFAATLMDWRHVRHVPVENDSGRLVGLVSHRALLRLVAQGRVGREHKVTVAEIMNRQPITVRPDTPTVEAIRMMRQQRLACLPVTHEGRLVGIVTEHDLIVVASRLLEAQLDGSE